MGLLENICWKQLISTGYRLSAGPANLQGPMLRFIYPNGQEGWCPESAFAGALDGGGGVDGQAHFDEQNCRRTFCESFAQGDPARGYFPILDIYGQTYSGFPDRWIFGTDADESLQLVLAVSPALADILRIAAYVPPGATDYPPDSDALYPPWSEDKAKYIIAPPNGWAGYPSEIRVMYTPFSAAERAAIGLTGDLDFQYAVYSMRGDLLGAPAGHIESGTSVSLGYSETNHGDGRQITWDLGGIVFAAYGVKSIDGIYLNVPGNANGDATTVGSVTIIGEPGSPYEISAKSTGGGLDLVSKTVMPLVSIDVQIELEPSELIT